MEKKVVATYMVEEEARRLFQESLGSVARVIYLEGVSKRKRSNTLEEADVVVSLSFSPTEIAHDEIPLLKKTELIQLVFSGADNVPFCLIPEGTIVASNPGAFAEPFAEHVLGLVLSLAKNLHVKHERLAKGIFDQRGFNTLLRGGICGVIGLGGNGSAVARIMRGIGMKVYATNRSGKTDEPVAPHWDNG
jgi:glycerate dehydrogenase